MMKARLHWGSSGPRPGQVHIAVRADRAFIFKSHGGSAKTVTNSCFRTQMCSSSSTHWPLTHRCQTCLEVVMELSLWLDERVWHRLRLRGEQTGNKDVSRKQSRGNSACGLLTTQIKPVQSYSDPLLIWSTARERHRGQDFISRSQNLTLR